MPQASPGSASALNAAFEDIHSRFLSTLPVEELESFDRLFFHLQEASWFYSDFYTDRDSTLPRMTLKTFCRSFFQYSPFLQPHFPQFEELFNNFKEYLGEVPVCGCILLTPDLKKCLMVRGWKCNTWGWPKGKINRDESELACAAREVFEEVGYDVSGKIHKKRYIDVGLNGNSKRMRMFLVPGVPENTSFETHTRKEIEEIKWFKITVLEKAMQRDQAQSTPGKKRFRFFGVRPLLSRLQSWIANSGHLHKSVSKPALRLAVPTPTPRTKKLAFEIPLKSGDEDEVTFGGNVHNSTGWSAEEMFSTNERLFNLQSTVPVDPVNLTAAEQQKFKQTLRRLGLKQGQGYGNTDNRGPMGRPPTLDRPKTSPSRLPMGGGRQGRPAPAPEIGRLQTFSFDLKPIMNTLSAAMTKSKFEFKLNMP